MIHTVKGLSVINEAEVLLEFSYFFYDPTEVDNLISGSSAFSKSSLYIWKSIYYEQIRLKFNFSRKVLWAFLGF